MEKLKIPEIKELLENTDVKLLPDVLKIYADDKRDGVRKLVAKFQNEYDKHIQELIRLEKICEYENKYRHCNYIAGVDEVGRGPLAGPVVTCAVILPKGTKIPYVNDSKKLSPQKREELYDVIMEKAVAVSIAMESPEVIDDINILQATLSAMEKSVKNLEVKPDVVLVDAVTIPNIDMEQVPIIKGDSKSISIASASIIAKVTRDRLMEEYDKLYPEYEFASNKGYGSSKHIKTLREIGPCPLHRKTFIKTFLE